MSDDQKIEMAVLRTRQAKTEGRLDRLENTLNLDALRCFIERKQRLEHATESDHQLIRNLAAMLPLGRRSNTIRYFEEIYAGTRQPPAGTGELVAAIRQAYGHGGPSGPTIRRALGKFSKFSSY